MNASPMKAPHEYPRRLLVAATGLSPQIVTETLYALAVRPTHGVPLFVPTEVHLVTTKEGAERTKLALLHPDSGWFHRLCAEYGLPGIRLDPGDIHVLADAAGAPLDDIRTPEDNALAADAIAAVVRDLTRDPNSALHVSIAGGRKTMGFYLGYTLSLYGRPQDRLSHVLVDEPYESHPDFFYPTRASTIIHTRDHRSRPYDTREARVTLADIPFVRLREELPAALIDGTARFGESVAAAQRAIGPVELVLDAESRRIRAGGRVLTLSSKVQFAFLAWFARRQQADEPWLACPADGAPETDYREAFMAELQNADPSGDHERTIRRLRSGMTRDFFSETKSKLHTKLRAGLGRRQSRPYEIGADGGRLARRYGLDIAPGAIRFSPVEPRPDTTAG